MGLFGPSFVPGGTVLAILALGHAVVCVTGVSGQVLMMTGKEQHMRNASIIALLVVFSLALILIPTYGMHGAAIASATAVASMGLYQLASVYSLCRNNFYRGERRHK